MATKPKMMTQTNAYVASSSCSPAWRHSEAVTRFGRLIDRVFETKLTSWLHWFPTQFRASLPDYPSSCYCRTNRLCRSIRMFPGSGVNDLFYAMDRINGLASASAARKWTCQYLLTGLYRIAPKKRRRPQLGGSWGGGYRSGARHNSDAVSQSAETAKFSF